MLRVTKPTKLREKTTIQNPKSKIQNSPSDAALAKKVALSCQILAKLGLFKETTGHVSARSGDGKRMLRERASFYHREGCRSFGLRWSSHFQGRDFRAAE
jgi:hypothetical protein